MNNAEKAKKLFENGYNCSQAVFCAFADELGLDEKTAFKIASSFGGGFGRLRHICGAVSGMGMVAGLKYGYDISSDPKCKSEHYKLIQELAGKFEEENSSIICHELLDGVKGKDTSPTADARTPEYYKKRPCAELVYCAAKIIEDKINE